MCSSAAACLLSSPLAISVSTSRSRGVSDARRCCKFARSARLRRDARLCARADSIARIKSASLNGFVRKSTAPALIARTDDGMSPCAVTNTIGVSFVGVIRRCSSRPLISGSSMSSTRQAGRSGFGYARYSAAEPNTTACMSKLDSSSLKASRIRRSSSTTKMM